FFFFKQKTAYEISRDWSSDVCSSDLSTVSFSDRLSCIVIFEQSPSTAGNDDFHSFIERPQKHCIMASEGMPYHPNPIRIDILSRNQIIDTTDMVEDGLHGARFEPILGKVMVADRPQAGVGGVDAYVLSVCRSRCCRAVGPGVGTVRQKLTCCACPMQSGQSGMSVIRSSVFRNVQYDGNHLTGLGLQVSPIAYN